MTPLRHTSATGGKLVILLLFLVSPLQAEFFVGPGGTAFPFLKIPISARATAMGGAFTAVTGDVATMEYNPAGLAEDYRLDMNLTMIKYMEDTKLQAVSAAYPLTLSRNVNLGDGFFGPDSNKIFLGLHYRTFQGDDTARAAGVDVGNFDIKDQLIQVGAAYAPFERLAMGTSIKMISSTIDNKTAKNTAFDFGMNWKLTAATTFGASLLNFGSDTAYISVADPLPTTLRTGLAYQSKHALLTADILSGNDKLNQEILGIEISPNSFLRLRGGLINSTDLDFSGGIGVVFSPSVNKISPAEKEKNQNRQILDELNIPQENPVYKEFGVGESKPFDFGIDYAIRTHQDLDVTHTVTLKMLY